MTSNQEANSESDRQDKAPVSEDINSNSMPDLSTAHGTLAGSAGPSIEFTYQDIGPYRIIEKIGEGGMGSVFRGYIDFANS